MSYRLQIWKINNNFLCDVIKAWFKLKNMYDEKNYEVLWYNSSIQINRKTIYYKSWSKEGINFISDLIIEKHWMTYEEFKNKFNVNCNFLKYFSVIHAVSTSFGNQLIESKHNRVSQLLIQLKYSSKASSFTYQLMCQKNVDTCIPMHCSPQVDRSVWSGNWQQQWAHWEEQDLFNALQMYYSWKQMSLFSIQIYSQNTPNEWILV